MKDILTGWWMALWPFTDGALLCTRTVFCGFCLFACFLISELNKQFMEYVIGYKVYSYILS